MMNYQLLTTSVPTLSSMMLILLSLLLFLVAFKASKGKGAKAGKMFVTLLGVTALASGMGGIKLYNNAHAAMEYFGLPLNDTEMSGHVVLKTGLNEFQNQLTKKLLITNVNCPTGEYLPFAPTSTPANKCTQGKVLEASDVCGVICGTPGEGSEELL